jgi:tetratricopeptide (TPR) repeat protein
MDKETTQAAPGLLESGKRLSQSSIWRLQRQFFDQRGVRAWSERIVPTHVTSNAFMAHAYAQIVAQFALECATQPAGSALALDPAEPLYIVELGAGSGYFAYLFLNKLVEIQAGLGADLPRICYVATDFTQSNVDYWAKHPCFAPFIEYGLFDVARFDAASDEQMILMSSGRSLLPGKVANPMVVVANYLFDTIPHDAFRVHNGVLEQGLASLRPREARGDGTNPLDDVDVSYEWTAVEGRCYDDEVLDGLLAEYADVLGNTAFTMPTGSFTCLRNLERLSTGRLMVLAADKGYSTPAALIGLSDPDVVHHGSVSMMVNFHALGRYVEETQGGFMMATSDRDASLELVALCSAAPASLPHTRATIADAFERLGPLDAYEISNSMSTDCTVSQALAVLRLCRWDPFTFTTLSPTLHKRAPDMTGREARRVRRALLEVWKLYFPIGDGRDVPFEIGFVMYGMRRYTEALYYYERSIEFHGAHEATLFNMGLCHYQLGQSPLALELFDRALEVSPTYGSARDWKLRVQTELTEDSPPVAAASEDAFSEAAAFEEDEQSGPGEADPPEPGRKPAPVDVSPRP